jgi:hypothetical protein
VRERLVFEIADAEFDDGVLAVLGLDRLEWLGAVGDERVVLPAGQQLARASSVRTRRTIRRSEPSVVSAICASLVGG